MIIKRFSATKVLNTNAPGFIRGRKYDTDFDRLSRGDTSRELSNTKINFSKELKEAKKKAKEELVEAGDFSKELRKTKNELENGRTGKWLRTE